MKGAGPNINVGPNNNTNGAAQRQDCILSEVESKADTCELWHSCRETVVAEDEEEAAGATVRLGFPAVLELSCIS